MLRGSSPNSEEAPGSTGPIATDTPCVNCGYNLRTLTTDALCPECAHPVADSVCGFFLRYSSPPWVRKVARGLVLILIAAAGVLVLPALLSAIATAAVAATGASVLFFTGQGYWPITVARFVGEIIPVCLAMRGILDFSSADPADPGDARRGAGARRALRWACVLVPVSAITDLAVVFTMPPLPQFTPGPTPPVIPASVLAALEMRGIIALAASWVSYPVVAVAVLNYLITLLRRIPRPGLVRFARIEFWGVLASFSFLALAFVVSAANFLPFYSALATLPTTLPTAPTTGPTTFYTTAVEYKQITPTGVRAYMTTATASTTLPAVPPASVIGFVGGACSMGITACSSFGFTIAAVVLLIMACKALFAAARDAEQNAAARAAPPRTDGASTPPA